MDEAHKGQKGKDGERRRNEAGKIESRKAGGKLTWRILSIFVVRSIYSLVHARSLGL
jgi:hypothetical protein